MNYEEIIAKIKSSHNPKAVAGMARYGINSNNTYGVSIPILRGMAKEIGKSHSLALQLWASGIHEARLLACFIDNPKQIDEDQMENWIQDFDSWDICDQCCGNLFDKTPFAYNKALEWSRKDEEFVKRAGFVLMTQLAVHDKKAADDRFIEFLPIIKSESDDDRNFVKKAVNWALRQIGKRNRYLNELAIETGREIQQRGTKAARWIAADALRELTDEKVLARLNK